MDESASIWDLWCDNSGVLGFASTWRGTCRGQHIIECQVTAKSVGHGLFLGKSSLSVRPSPPQKAGNKFAKLPHLLLGISSFSARSSRFRKRSERSLFLDPTQPHQDTDISPTISPTIMGAGHWKLGTQVSPRWQTWVRILRAPTPRSPLVAVHPYAFPRAIPDRQRLNAAPQVVMPTNLSLLIHVPNTFSNDQNVIRLPTAQHTAPPPPARRTSFKRWSMLAPKSPRVAAGARRPVLTVITVKRLTAASSVLVLRVRLFYELGCRGAAAWVVSVFRAYVSKLSKPSWELRSQQVDLERSIPDVLILDFPRVTAASDFFVLHMRAMDEIGMHPDDSWNHDRAERSASEWGPLPGGPASFRHLISGSQHLRVLVLFL
ncbi:hypothetical protein C8R44DRAFT_724327 [Mycena epipterygia]|nr:hypothetical protein C8R44DRAFT_724327 [Mycena epipterygia]